MIGYLFIALIFGIGYAIYYGIWNGTRKILDNEKEKISYLKSKYEYLVDLNFDQNTSITDEDFERVLRLLSNNGFKKGTITEINLAIPYNEKKPWKVELTVKSGTWPFNDKEKNFIIYSILDNELEELKHFKDTL